MVNNKLNCPHCDKEIRDESAVYCPYCAKSLQRTPSKLTSFPIAGGILAVIAASLSAFLGIAGIMAFISSITHRSYYSPPSHSSLLMGVFGVLAFALGLAGGILSIRRRIFVMSLVGPCITIASGFVATLAGALTAYGSLLIGMLLGAPVFILSILGLIFTAIAKNEFT